MDRLQVSAFWPGLPAHRWRLLPCFPGSCYIFLKDLCRQHFSKRSGVTTRLLYVSLGHANL
jgi:hypothetical protein